LCLFERTCHEKPELTCAGVALAKTHAEGALHHIIVRGIERRKIFWDDEDRDSYVTRRGRYPDTVEARGVLCYWAARGLGISTLELSKRFGISQPTASQSVKRGEKIVKEKGLKLLE